MPENDGDGKIPLKIVIFLLTCSFVIFAPLTSAMVNRFGFRLITICGAIFAGVLIGITYFANSIWFLSVTYCILGAFGLSMVYVPSVTIIGFYFEKWRGLATGIVLCGSGVGKLILASLCERIANPFSWSFTFVVQAGLITLCAVFALAFRPLQSISMPAPASNKHNSDFKKRLPDGRVAYIMPRYAQNASPGFQNPWSQKGFRLLSEGIRRTHSSMLDISLLLSPSFMLLAFSRFLYAVGLNVPFMYLKGRARDNYMDIDSARKILSGIMTITLFATFLCGSLCSIPRVKALWINNIVITIGGVATLLSGIVVTSSTQWAFAIFFGISYGCFKVLPSLIAVEMYGLEKLIDAYGLLLLFEGLGQAASWFIARLLHNVTGSYDVPFYFAGAVILLSAFLCYPLTYVANWEKARRERNLVRPV